MCLNTSTRQAPGFARQWNAVLAQCAHARLAFVTFAALHEAAAGSELHLATCILLPDASQTSVHHPSTVSSNEMPTLGPQGRACTVLLTNI